MSKKNVGKLNIDTLFDGFVVYPKLPELIISETALTKIRTIVQHKIDSAKKAFPIPTVDLEIIDGLFVSASLTKEQLKTLNWFVEYFGDST